MEADHWRDRDVFVTGHTGFKGAWLSVLLHRLGARVHGYALETPKHFLFHRARLGEIMASDVRGDIRDRAAMASALNASATSGSKTNAMSKAGASAWPARFAKTRRKS